MKQILIIGGSGAIGSALISEYDKNDVHITVASRKKQNLGTLVKLKVAHPHFLYFVIRKKI